MTHSGIVDFDVFFKLLKARILKFLKEVWNDRAFLLFFSTGEEIMFSLKLLIKKKDPLSNAPQCNSGSFFRG